MRGASANDPLVRVGVGVFIFRSRTEKRFVFGLRKGSHGAGLSETILYAQTLLTHITGTWSLPGGHLEYGESFVDCAIGETAEETGLEIEDVKYLTAVETVFAEERRHYVTIFVTAVAKTEEDGSVREPLVSRVGSNLMNLGG